MSSRFTHRLLLLAAASVTTARLFANTPDAVVTINEIHYNPPVSQDGEWIELHNQMAVNVDISGWSLANGVTYTIPANTVIPGGGYLVIAKSLANPALTGISGLKGPFAGNLSNSGEIIDLVSSSGRLMDRLEYGDTGDWPVAADGAGASLAKRLPGMAAANPANWRASLNPGGTPAASNFQAPDQPVVHTLADSNTPWRYHDSVTAPAASWNSKTFDDSAWPQGLPAFGSTSSVPFLSVTADLTERFRAGALTGLADGDEFTTWPDTATGDGVSQDATDSGDPRFETNATPSGQPAVSFDGNDGFRTAIPPGITSNSGFVYFIVCKSTGFPSSGGTGDGSGDYIFDRDSAVDNPLASLKVAGGNYGFQVRYDDGNGIGGPVSSTPISSSEFQIVAVRRNPALGRFEIWVDGNLEGTSGDSGAALTPQPIVIGRHATTASQGFPGEIAELLVYRNELSDTDFNKVGAYLEARYGLNTAFPNVTVQTPISATASTSYFRRTFTYNGDPSRTVLGLDHMVADGAVFYLNGQEIARANMPAGTPGHATSALSDVLLPTPTGLQPVSASALVVGTNVLSASVHTGASDNTAFFSADLEAVEAPVDPDLPAALLLNEIASSDAPVFFIELGNPGDGPAATVGFSLEVIGSQQASYPLPVASVPAGGFLHFTEAELGFRPASGDKIILRSPGGALVDVRAAETEVRGLSALWPGRWLFPSVATPGTVNTIPLQQDIVINEICYNPPDVTPASDNKQWLELYNRGSSPVNLTGWNFASGITFDFPAGTVLAPGAYLAVAKDPTGLLAAFPGIPVTGSFSGNLAGSGERLLLVDDAGNPADEVSYLDGGRWPGAADAEGSTLELRSPHADNSLPESWAASDESARRTWRTYSYHAMAVPSSVGNDNQWRDFIFGLLDSGDILLDDITVTETSGNVAMITGGDFESGLGGWRFVGNHRHAELVPDPTNPGNTVLHLSAKGPTEHMHNHVETTLAPGRTVTNGLDYTISFRARWLSGSNRLNTRLYFNRVAATTLLDRTDNPGTPGTANSTAVPNTGPGFTAMSHSPVVPSPAQAVTVTARAEDPDGPGTFTLHYSVAGAAYVPVPMAGDGATFTGSIPAQPAATVVRFYVSATDGAAVPATSFFPAKGADSYALYQVNDGLATSNGRHNVRIVMDPVNKALLYRTNNLMSNERLGCTVIYDEKEVYYDVGARLKSSERGRPSSSRVGFSIGFNKDQLFRGVHRTVSIDRSEGQEPGCFEILFDHMMYASRGVPAEYNDLCKVIAPDPANTSSAILQLARYGDVFLDSQFENGSDGTSYEYELIYYPTTADPNGYKLPQPDDTRGADVTNLGDSKENYRWTYLIENNEDVDDYSRMIAMAKHFDKSGAAFSSTLGDIIDIDQWLRALAYSCASGAGDSFYANANHNGIFYARPDGRVLYFPHDMDFSFDQNRSIFENSELNKIVLDPLQKRKYLGHLRDICTTVFQQDYMADWTAHYGSMLPGEDFAGHLSYINNRSNSILSQINSSVPPMGFTIDGGNFSTGNSPVNLTGKGWVDVHEIRLAGSSVPLAVTWTNVNSWRVSIPLSPGANLIALEAFDMAGRPVGNDSRTITYTGNLIQPTGSTLVVCEIFFNPAGSVETTEYVELMNISPTATLDLSGLKFEEGLDFTFPASTTLLPGARVLVVKDTTAFNAAFGAGRPIAGTFPANLDNGGARITLRRPDQVTVQTFEYKDEEPWPLAADGDGYSLVLVDPLSAPDHSDPMSWRASVAVSGSPGQSDTQSYAAWKAANGNLPDDEDSDGDGLSNRMEYFLGGNPAVAEPELVPTFEIEEGGSFLMFVTRRVGAEGAAVLPQTSTDLGDWDTAENYEFLANERVSNSPPRDLLLFRVTPPPAAPKFFARFNFGN